jgi:aspartyl/asparaginyl-tRNA synthetase
MSPSAVYADGNGLNGAPSNSESRIVDARVHRVESVQPDVLIILLRYADQFLPTAIKSSAVDAETFTKAQQLTPETLLRVTLANEYDAVQEKEISIISKLHVLGEAKLGIPKNILSHGAPGEVKDDAMAMTPEGVQQRFDNRILDARVSANAAVAKLFSAVFEVAVEQLIALDFWRIPTPALIGWEFPGDEHEQFALNYFDIETAWLSQTGDVHLEMALAADFERVYDVHTVFRREENVTSRHMTEVSTFVAHGGISVY